jgi:hypothetical protein
MVLLPRDLPFTATVNLGDTIHHSEIYIAFAATGLDDTLQHVDTFFKYFSVAANAGMFAGSKVHPSDSFFGVVDRQRTDREVQYHCRIGGIDHGAFRILLNVAAEVARRGRRLDTVSIWSKSSEQPTNGLHEVLSSPYPGRVRITPFELLLGELFFENREPLMRMRFRRAVTDEEFEQIQVLVKAWDCILMLGGYLDAADRDGDLLPEPGEFFLAEPLVIEHLIYAYQGPEESFNALVNLAVRLDVSVCPLSAMEIE